MSRKTVKGMLVQPRQLQETERLGGMCLYRLYRFFPWAPGRGPGQTPGAAAIAAWDVPPLFSFCPNTRKSRAVLLARLCLLAAEQFLPSQNTSPWCCPIRIGRRRVSSLGRRSQMPHLVTLTSSVIFLMVPQAGFFIYQCLPSPVRAGLRRLL